MGGVARAAGGKASQTVRSVSDRAVKTLKLEAEKGRAAAWAATGGAPTGSASFHAANSNRATAPDWARRLRHEQNMRAHRHSTTQAVRDGDRPGSGANPSLDEKGE
jgi:type IV secretion system protein TrbL